MTPVTKIAAAAATATSAVALALPGVAAAAHAGERNFEQSYPVASKLCAEVAKGGGKPRLKANAATVLADCTTLQNNFNSARSAVITLEADIAAAVSADNLARRTICTSKPSHPVRCLIARRRTHRLHVRLSHEKLVTARNYWRTLEVNRRVFWAEIHALPGLHGLATDKPIPEQNS